MGVAGVYPDDEPYDPSDEGEIQRTSREPDDYERDVLNGDEQAALADALGGYGIR
jgi:hypothetical protein